MPEESIQDRLNRIISTDIKNHTMSTITLQGKHHPELAGRQVAVVFAPVGEYFQPVALTGYPFTAEMVDKEVKISPFSMLVTQVPEESPTPELLARELEVSIEDAAVKFFTQFEV